MSKEIKITYYRWPFGFIIASNHSNKNDYYN